MSELRPKHNAPSFPRNGSVVVVGIVRNIEKSFNRDFQRLSLALKRFSRIDWHVVESGSTDSSEDVLETYANDRENFSYKHLEHQPQLSRTENMAIARNSYLDYLRTDSRFLRYEYVIMADFNDLNDKLTATAVESCFDHDSWDVLTANQQGRYYDAWALRHPLWSPNDCWEQHAFYRKYTKFPESAITFSMRSRMLRIPSNSELIEVDSAFGGLAIYKSSVFNSKANYVGITDEEKPICEHVPFHSKLKAEGARIFINPALINTRVTDHSRQLSPLFMLLRICRYPFRFLMKNNQHA
jgi:glycosyltransferase involved in cell wall biosynthesis